MAVVDFLRKLGRSLRVVLDITANNPAPENTRDRQIRFDINCKTADGERVNVEMCLNPNRFEPARLEFHAARLFAAQDIMGKNRSFADLKRTYQIAILGNRTYFPDGDFFNVPSKNGRGLRASTRPKLTYRPDLWTQGGKV